MIRQIEINFPVLVELPLKFTQELGELIDKVCKHYETSHPGRVMWPAEHGSKITYMPLTLEEEKERGIEFDDSAYHVGVCEREDYGWKERKR